MKITGIWFLISLAMILIWVGICEIHRRVPPFTDDNCIRALLGEYSLKDPYGLSLMAHAIRNRGTLKGVYGFHAAHVDHEPKIVWELASLAWFESENAHDPIRGASEWRSVNDVRRGHIPRGMYLVKIYNGTYFYKNPSK